MMKRKKKGVLTVCTMLCLINIVGCTKITSSLPEDGYNTEYAMSAIEYSIFLSKQIGVAENVLFTRLSIARSIEDGNYEISKELQNTEEAISKITSIKDEITVTMPASGYDTDRQNTLDLIEDAKLVLEDYIALLEVNDTSSIDGIVTELENCYIALGGESNIYYQ